MKTYVLASSLIACLCAGPVAGEAQAQPPTKYTHYLVGGSTAQSLYKSMVRKGPHVNGYKAYAATRMSPKISAKLSSGEGQCRVQKFDLSMSFVISLPKLSDTASLDPSVKRSFDNFYAFAKKHEEMHRTIWLKCAAEAEARINAVKAGTCKEAEATALRIFDDVAKACNGRHEAFDAAEQTRLAKHPFIKLVAARAKQRSTKVAALSAGKKARKK